MGNHLWANPQPPRSTEYFAASDLYGWFSWRDSNLLLSEVVWKFIWLQLQASIAEGNGASIRKARPRSNVPSTRLISRGQDVENTHTFWQWICDSVCSALRLPSASGVRWHSHSFTGSWSVLQRHPNSLKNRTSNLQYRNRLSLAHVWTSKCQGALGS